MITLLLSMTLLAKYKMPQVETAASCVPLVLKDCIVSCVCVRQQMLEEICVKNGWGAPTYVLCESDGVDGKLYAYKVNCYSCFVVRASSRSALVAGASNNLGEWVTD